MNEVTYAVEKKRTEPIGCAEATANLPQCRTLLAPYKIATVYNLRPAVRPSKFTDGSLRHDVANTLFKGYPQDIVQTGHPLLAAYPL